MKRIISLGMIAVFLVTLMTAGALPALAKGKKGKKGTKVSVSGTVVHGKSGKGVEGARVHVKHKHKSHAKSSAATAPKTKGVPKNKTAKKHHGVTTAKGGSFTLKTSGSGKHTIIAHKKGVGSGHAEINGQSSGITIKLHKHHHHHSKTATKPKTK